MLVPITIELLFLIRFIENEKRLYFYMTCGLRRSANLIIFISSIYLIGNLLIPIVILLIIEILVGILIYKKTINNITLKKLIIVILAYSFLSWTIVYIIFRFVFIKLI
jgi:hypothetical protein